MYPELFRNFAPRLQSFTGAAGLCHVETPCFCAAQPQQQQFWNDCISKSRQRACMSASCSCAVLPLGSLSDNSTLPTACSPCSPELAECFSVPLRGGYGHHCLQSPKPSHSCRAGHSEEGKRPGERRNPVVTPQPQLPWKAPPLSMVRQLWYNIVVADPAREWSLWMKSLLFCFFFLDAFHKWPDAIHI